MLREAALHRASAEQVNTPQPKKLCCVLISTVTCRGLGWSEGSDEVLWCQALRHAGEEHAKQSRIDDELSAMMGELSAAQVRSAPI